MRAMVSLFREAAQGALVSRFTKNVAEKHSPECQIGFTEN